MLSNWGKAVVAGIAVLIFGLGVIYFAHAAPFWPPTGTDLASSCGGATPSAPLPVATDGTNFACWPSWPSTFQLGAPNARTFSTGTAYQATNATKAAIVAFSIKSTATISISGGATNQLDVYVSPTSSGATGGTGQLVCEHGNSNTGTLTIGLNLSTISTTPCSFALPVGWYFSVNVVQGLGSIIGASDSSAG